MWLLFAFAVGVYAAFQQSQLLAPEFYLLLPASLVVIFLRLRFLTLIATVASGFLYTQSYSWLNAPGSFDLQWQGKNIEVIGRIVGLPEQRERSQRFVFDVEVMRLNGEKLHGPRRIRLDWYFSKAPLEPDQRWLFTVRLKRPRGYANPGSFDFERYLYEQGIGALGYVHRKGHQQALQSSDYGLHQWRYRLVESMRDVIGEHPQRSFIEALVTGERSGLSQGDWQVLNDTGTNHLMAISGLHIGLVAGFVYWLMNRVWRRSHRLCLWIAAPKIAALVAVVVAFVYAALAGFAIPTQRALIMLCIFMLSISGARNWRPLHVLAMAWLAVILFDPFAFLSAGFWLSFAAVAAIFYAMHNRHRGGGWWWKWGRVQWIITLLLLPVLVYFFQRFSLISPLTNFIAVPWMSFSIVPPALLGTLFLWFPALADIFFFVATFSMQWLWHLLEWSAQWSYAAIETTRPVLWTLLASTIGVLWMLMPRGLPFRFIGAAWLLPLFLIRPAYPERGELRLTVLDVGQGTAVVMETAHHVVLYDTGPKFSSGFNTGEAVVLPFLRHQGRRAINTLVLSHGDSDHAGGLASIRQGTRVERFLNGAMKKRFDPPYEPCIAGERWQLDDVHFEIIYPRQQDLPLSDNDGSCVLKIDVGGQILLLTGDIEQKAERFLLESLGLSLKADVMLVPHHGSKTSSGAAFIEAVEPQIALNSVGFNNRYGLPDEKVMQRYKERGVELWSTAEHGAISLTVGPRGMSRPQAWRNDAKRFWHF